VIFPSSLGAWQLFDFSDLPDLILAWAGNEPSPRQGRRYDE